MSATDAFLDTNVLVYAVSGDPSKAARAEELLRRGGTVSIQVLMEFVDVVRRKHGIDWNELVDALDIIRSLCRIAEVTTETFTLALDLSRRHRVRIFDGMIVAAAIHSGASTLWSEDMHDGQVIGPVTIRNPFQVF